MVVVNMQIDLDATNGATVGQHFTVLLNRHFVPFSGLGVSN